MKKGLTLNIYNGCGVSQGCFLLLRPFVKMLNTIQPRRRVLAFVRARIRRFLLNPVVVWFAGIIFVTLMAIMIMILLLNIDVAGVDDLLAGIPHDVTGVCDGSRWFCVYWLIITDRNPRTHLSPRSYHPWTFHQLGVGRMRRLQATVVPWTFW